MPRTEPTSDASRHSWTVRLARRIGWTAVAATAGTAAVVAVVVLSAVALVGTRSSAPVRPTAGGKALTASPTQSPTSAAPSAALSSLANSVACPERPREVTAAELKAFTSIAVLTCGDETRDYTNDGEWLVHVRKIATEGVAALQAAFELPSQPFGSPPPSLPPGASYGCTLDLVVTPPLIFVDAAGNTLAPTAPTTSCGKPLPELLTAERAIAWQVVSVHKLRQLVTPQAQAAHCDMQWKNENWIAQEMSGGQSKGGPVFMSPPATLHVCVYRVSSKDLEVGDFERALDLTGSDARSLTVALEGAAPTGRCTAQRQFAVIHSPPGGWANVELGGCWRVARNYPNFATGSADSATVSRLLQR